MEEVLLKSIFNSRDELIMKCKVTRVFSLDQEVNINKGKCKDSDHLPFTPRTLGDKGVPRKENLLNQNLEDLNKPLVEVLRERDAHRGFTLLTNILSRSFIKRVLKL
jgi:hypothetical protein